MRHGGFYHAVARYGEDLWIPFSCIGLHATERALRRKEQHRFWGVDCYSHQEDRYLRIGNRLFHADPDLAVEPSGLVVVAADAWAGELARNTLSNSTPTQFCTPDGRCSEAVELRPSRDLVSDPAGHPTVGRPESVGLWLKQNPDMEAIDGRAAHRLFLAVCQFPGNVNHGDTGAGFSFTVEFFTVELPACTGLPALEGVPGERTSGNSQA